MKLFPSLDSIKEKSIQDDKIISINFVKDWNNYVTNIIENKIPFNLEYFEYNISDIIKKTKPSLLIKLSEVIVNKDKINKEIISKKLMLSNEMVQFYNTGINQILSISKDKQIISYSQKINPPQLLAENILKDDYQAALFSSGTCRISEIFNNARYLYDFINDYEDELSISNIITLISTSNVSVSDILVFGLYRKETDNINSRRFTSAIVSILASLSTEQISMLLDKLDYDRKKNYRFDLLDSNSYEKEDTFKRIVSAIQYYESQINTIGHRYMKSLIKMKQ